MQVPIEYPAAENIEDSAKEIDCSVPQFTPGQRHFGQWVLIA